VEDLRRQLAGCRLRVAIKTVAPRSGMLLHAASWCCNPAAFLPHCLACFNGHDDPRPAPPRPLQMSKLRQILAINWRWTVEWWRSSTTDDTIIRLQSIRCTSIIDCRFIEYYICWFYLFITFQLPIGDLFRTRYSTSGMFLFDQTSHWHREYVLTERINSRKILLYRSLFSTLLMTDQYLNT